MFQLDLLWPDLFQLGGLAGKPVADRDGKTLGHVVDGMAECASGHIAYLVVREGSEAALNERLRELRWQSVRIDQDHILLGGGDLSALPEIEPTRWPGRLEG